MWSFPSIIPGLRGLITSRCTIPPGEGKEGEGEGEGGLPFSFGHAGVTWYYLANFSTGDSKTLPRVSCFACRQSHQLPPHVSILNCALPMKLSAVFTCRSLPFVSSFLQRYYEKNRLLSMAYSIDTLFLLGRISIPRSTSSCVGYLRLPISPVVVQSPSSLISSVSSRGERSPSLPSPAGRSL